MSKNQNVPVVPRGTFWFLGSLGFWTLVGLLGLFACMLLFLPASAGSLSVESTATPTEIPTNTPTALPTSTPTATQTNTPTQTPLPTKTPTKTPTATLTSTPTITPTPTETLVPYPEGWDPSMIYIKDIDLESVYSLDNKINSDAHTGLGSFDPPLVPYMPSSRIERVYRVLIYLSDSPSALGYMESYYPDHRDTPEEFYENIGLTWQIRQWFLRWVQENGWRALKALEPPL